MRQSLYVTLFLTSFGLIFVYPIFTPLILDNTLLPESLTLAPRMLYLALLLAIYPIAQLIFAPIFEHYSCIHGPKKWLVYTTLGQGVGFLLSGIGIVLHHYPLLVCSRLVTGACSGSLALALGSITTIKKKQFETIAILNGLSFIGAIFFGGELSQISPTLPFWILATATPLFSLYIARTFTNPKQCLARPTEKIKQYKRLLCEKKIRPLYISLFFFMIGWITTLQFLSAFLLDHFTESKELITVTFLISGGIWLLTYILIFPKKRPLLTTSLVGVALATAILSQTTTYSPFLISLCIASLFASLSWTKLLTTISSCAPPALHAIPLSLNQIVTLGAMVVAPLVGGALGTYDSRYIYIFAAISYSLATITYCVKKYF